MTRDQYNRSMARLQLMFGRTIPREQAEAWFEFLEHHESEALANAVDQIVQTKKLFPSLAEILDTTQSFERVDTQALPDYNEPVDPDTARKFLTLLKGKVAS